MNNSNSLAKKTFWSVAWTILDIFATKFTSFFVGIILARLLTPEDYGLIGLLSIFIALSNIIIESGFGNALIRKQDRSDVDYSVAFFFNLIVGVICYAILASISPWVAEFYSIPLLSDLLRVLGVNVVILSLCNVPNAILIANFDIKKQTKANFIGNLTSAVIAIYLAYHGWGVWSLVWQTLLSSLFRVILLWLQVKWKPVFIFSKDSFKYLWGFGSKSLTVQLLGSFFNEIYGVLVGKFFTQAALGLFSRADQIVRLFPSTLSSVFSRVCIATFSNLQNDLLSLLKVYRKFIHVVSFVIFPCMSLLLIDAKPLVLCVLTDKWSGSIIFIQILCIGLAFGPFGSINLMLLQAINKVKYSMKLEIYKKILFVAMLAISLPMGLIAMVIGSSVYNFIATMMNLSCSKMFLNYGYKEQLVDMGQYILLSTVCASVSYFSTLMIENNVICLLIRSIIFLTMYISISYILKLKALRDVKDLKQKI